MIRFCETCGAAVPCPCAYAPPKVVLMRGLAGSGKSTLAARLAKENSGIVISADDYFTDDEGVYRYDRSKIRRAHEDAQERLNEALCDGGWRYIVVDNTHITHRDIAEYLRIAAGYGAVVEVVEPTTPWAWNPDECAKRNVHDVPSSVVHGMAKRYQPMTSAEAQEWADTMRREALESIRRRSMERMDDLYDPAADLSKFDPWYGQEG
jgi:predicted kinase